MERVEEGSWFTAAQSRAENDSLMMTTQPPFLLYTVQHPNLGSGAAHFYSRSSHLFNLIISPSQIRRDLTDSEKIFTGVASLLVD